MFGLSVRIEDYTQKVVQAAEKASFRNIPHAAAAIRKTAVESIVSAEGPSAPGSPPHTHTAKVTKSGKQRKGELQRAIVYDYDRNSQSAVIGPRESVVGPSGAAHEFGGASRGETYPERPFMGPALQSNLSRFTSEFQGSISE